MQTNAAIAPSRSPRRATLSKARAYEIVEAAALKYDLPVHTIMCARWDRYARIARAEVAHHLGHKMSWSQRAIGEYLGIHWTKVRSLFALHEIESRRAMRCLPATDVHALVAVRGDDRLRQVVEAEERAAYAEAELARLTGGDLALRLAGALELTHRMRCAIVLAIVAEAYPRVVLGSEMLEHYDEACVRLGYGGQNGANFNLLTKNVAHLREHFETHAWPVPICAADSFVPRELVGARRLSDEGAAFLHARLGAPRLSQMETANDLRSARIPLSVSR